MQNSRVAKSLKDIFSDRSRILLGFLFGSSARNCLRPSSDVDIGIFFRTVPEIDSIDALREELSSVLRREVDLVVLNHASPILKMQILKNGTLFYAIDKKYFHQFFAQTVNEYDDLKRIRKNCEDSILKGRIYAR